MSFKKKKRIYQSEILKYFSKKISYNSYREMLQQKPEDRPDSEQLREMLGACMDLSTFKYVTSIYIYSYLKIC